MKDSMAKLYAHLLMFLHQAVKWFSRHSTGRVLSAVLKPFELKNKGLIDQIQTYTKTIDEEASAAFKAELRGLHVDVQKNGKRIAELSEKMDEKYKMHEERLDIFDTKLEEISIQIKDMRHKVTNVQGVVRDTRTRVIDLQFNDVINNLKPQILPEDSLRKQKALVNRGKPGLNSSQGMVEVMQRLDNWICAPDSPILILQAGPRAQLNAKQLAIELLCVLEPTKVAVIWHFSDGNQQEDFLSMTDILRCLVFQLYRIAPELLNPSVEGVNATRLQAQHSEAEWLNLLCLTLSRFHRCFLLCEASGASDRCKQDGELLKMLEVIVDYCRSGSCLLKVMLLSGTTNLAGSVKCSETSTIITVQRPDLYPPHLRRSGARQNNRGYAWSGVRKLL